MNTVHEMVRFRRLRWLGHVARQEDTRLPQRLMHSRLPSKASRGRPPKCWTDYVREDLESLKLLLNWAQLARIENHGETRYRISLDTHPAPCWKCVID